MMNKKKIFPITNAGTASILTVFVVLAMVAFALLSYMSARRGAGYAGQFAREAQAWQEAKAQALEKIASLDQEFYEAWEDGSFPELLGKKHGFSIPVEEGKELQVTLVPVLPEENQGHLYRITSFQEVNTEEWEGSNSLRLLDPSKLTENTFPHRKDERS